MFGDPGSAQRHFAPQCARDAALLNRRHDGRVLQRARVELLREHVLRRIDIEHRLDAGEIRRPARLAREIVAESLTVRELERRLRDVVTAPGKKKAGRPRKTDQQPEVRRIEDRLRKFLQTDVSLNVGRNYRGTLTIQFYSVDDLERVLELLKVPG